MIRLRPWRSEDEEDFVRLVTDPDNMARLGGPAPDPAGLFSRLVQKTTWPNERAWAIEVATPEPTGSAVGHVFLTRTGPGEPWELGYLLAPAARGRGFATEAARQACKNVDEGDVIFATVDLDHSASKRVLEKLGFRCVREEVDEEGRFLRYERPRGRVVQGMRSDASDT